MSSTDLLIGGVLGFGLGAGAVYLSGVLDKFDKPLEHQLTWGGRRGRGGEFGTGGPPDVHPSRGRDLLLPLIPGIAGDHNFGAAPGGALEAARWATVQTMGEAIAANPGEFTHYVTAFGRLMADAGSQLERLQTAVRVMGEQAQQTPKGSPQREAALAWGHRYAGLARRYEELSDGFWKHAAPAGVGIAPGSTVQSLGAAPVVVVAVVAGVAVSVAAIAWAIVAWRETQVLRDEIALEAQDLEARAAAAAGGYRLPKSTLPEPPGDEGFPWLPVAGGFAALGLLGLAAADYGRRRS